MSSRRLVGTAAALVVVIGGAGWAAPLAVPLRVPHAPILSTRAQTASGGTVIWSQSSGVAQRGGGPDSTGAYRVGGPIRPPRKIADVPPIYSQEAQNAKAEGVIVLEARIDEKGNVSDTRLLRSIPMLDEAAIAAVRKWRYEPTLVNGNPVPVLLTVTVNFTLRDSAPGIVVSLAVSVPESLQRTSGATRLRIRESDVGVIMTRDNQVFGFVPLAPSEAASDRMRIGVYRMNPEAGPIPQPLATVELSLRGGTLQTPTTPALGLELLSIDRR
jgi:TonB family protein